MNSIYNEFSTLKVSKFPLLTEQIQCGNRLFDISFDSKRSFFVEAPTPLLFSPEYHREMKFRPVHIATDPATTKQTCREQTHAFEAFTAGIC